jgi:hypothetical protein
MIDIPNLKVVQEKALAFIMSQPDIYNRVSNANLNPLNDDVFAAVPELRTILDGFTCMRAYAFVTWQRDQVSIHTDAVHYIARLNIPLLNTEGSQLRFFSGAKFLHHKNPRGAWVKTVTNPTEIVETCSVEYRQAAVVNVSEAHTVTFDERAQFPRITLSLMFDKDPGILLTEPSN